jgi:hypothetical protein
VSGTCRQCAKGRRKPILVPLMAETENFALLTGKRSRDAVHEMGNENASHR